MQFSLPLIILGVAGLTSALPVIGNKNIAVRDAQPHAAEAQIEVKRDDDQDVVTETVEVEVDVDENGNPISTQTTTVTGPTPTPTPDTQEQTPQPQEDVQTTQQDTATTPQPSSGGLGQGDLSGSSFNNGATWGALADDGSCKSTDQMTSEVKDLISKGVDLIRLYDLSCNGPQTLQAAVAGTSTWMFLGLPDITQASDAAGQLAQALNNKWDNVHTVAVGNEDGDFAGSAAAVDTARSVLRGAGYTGPVVTAGTCQNMATNAQICSTSDYCAANCHTYWDGVAASNSGASIKAHIDSVKTTNPGKNVIVTEAGWPTCGDAISGSIPGKTEQGQAISAISSDFSATNVVHFSAYNEGWKDPGQWNIERCWGMY